MVCAGDIVSGVAHPAFDCGGLHLLAARESEIDSVQGSDRVQIKSLL